MSIQSPTQSSIASKLKQKFVPTHLEVLNESHQHSGPDGAESHFRVIVVSEVFTGLSRVQRQRMVYELLAEELSSSVHALAQRLFTPEEWASRGEQDGSQSPKCHGGNGL